MNATDVKLQFCNTCDKATHSSAVTYHYANPCTALLNGWDCMHFEAENLFCQCEVAA
jgi:hypothetical protein